MFCDVGNRFTGAAALILGKNRTVRLPGGTGTGGAVLSWGKGLVSFQRIEKSDIPAAREYASRIHRIISTRGIIPYKAAKANSPA